MSEYVFRYAPGYGCDMSDMMDGGRVTVGEYFASDATDHYGTLHEEVIRCRDCKHYHEAGVASYTPFCEWMNDSDVTPGGFCAWGVREDGDAR